MDLLALPSIKVMITGGVLAAAVIVGSTPAPAGSGKWRGGCDVTVQAPGRSLSRLGPQPDRQTVCAREKFDTGDKLAGDPQPDAALLRRSRREVARERVVQSRSLV